LTTLLLPFWRSLIPNLRFVICVRSPLAVANSLQARNKVPMTWGVFLWERYLRASLAATASCRRLVVFCDYYFNKPEREIAALLDFCCLRPSGGGCPGHHPRRSSHQQSDLSELLAFDQISNETKLLYWRCAAWWQPERFHHRTNRPLTIQSQISCACWIIRGSINRLSGYNHVKTEAKRNWLICARKSGETLRPIIVGRIVSTARFCGHFNFIAFAHASIHDAL